jgi:hypothetical protein
VPGAMRSTAPASFTSIDATWRAVAAATSGA